MADISDIILTGRIGKDGAELKQTVTGKPYLRFSLANNKYVNGQEKTQWFDVKVFDQFTIENVGKLLTKGTPVYVCGDIVAEPNIDKTGRVWQNFYVTAIRVAIMNTGRKDKDEIVNMSSGASVTTIQKPPQQQSLQVQQPIVPTEDQVVMTTGSFDDDIPF